MKIEEYKRRGSFVRRKPKECIRTSVTFIFGVVFGFFIGVSFPDISPPKPAYEKIGVVDAQWIVHLGVPSLGNQGKEKDGKAPWKGVRDRCKHEWKTFQNRLLNAEKAYYKSIGVENMIQEANPVHA